MIKPVLAVGFLAAAWTQERGGKPALRMLLRGFGANLAALLPLGIVFVAGVSIALGATALIDGGQLLDMLYGAAPAADADPTGAARQRAGHAGVDAGAARDAVRRAVRAADDPRAMVRARARRLPGCAAC